MARKTYSTPVMGNILNFGDKIPCVVVGEFLHKDVRKVKMTKFKSEIAINFFGKGVSIEMTSKDEIKSFFNFLPTILRKKSRAWWDEETLISRLHYLKEDIQILQLRLIELSK